MLSSRHADQSGAHGRLHTHDALALVLFTTHMGCRSIDDRSREGRGARAKRGVARLRSTFSPGATATTFWLFVPTDGSARGMPEERAQKVKILQRGSTAGYQSAAIQPGTVSGITRRETPTWNSCSTRAHRVQRGCRTADVNSQMGKTQ